MGETQQIARYIANLSYEDIPEANLNDMTGNSTNVFGLTAKISTNERTAASTNHVVLHGYYSQTYRPEHHNFSEHFLFEPQLEPGISRRVLNELRSQDIRLIQLIIDRFGGGSRLMTYGFDPEMSSLGPNWTVYE